MTHAAKILHHAKRIIMSAAAIACTSMSQAQTTAYTGWPADYGGVMLQGFYWDGFGDAQWTRLAAQAADFAPYFSLVWLPQSGNCGGTSMGYDDLYWFNNYNSSFGTEAELRQLIGTFREAGIGAIADVVINHRCNVSNWVDFPRETYQGETYELVSTDICANDDGGDTQAWATANGYSLSSANDTGEGWSGMRDLDHSSANVQRCVHAYLHFLLNDLGYAGFRYDMVKGYAALYTNIYNTQAQPAFSVGECWDGTTTIRNWIDGTGKTSAAFDFQFRYTVRNAINQSNWAMLGRQNDGNWPLVSNNYESGAYRQWAVTFVENHDTEYRSAKAQQDPIRCDTLAANAYMLAMPGTPCVFLKHWKAYKHELARMIQARQLCGITNTSTVSTMRSAEGYYAACVTGTKGALVVWVGNQDNAAATLTGYTCLTSGYHYSYWTNDAALLSAWQTVPEPTFAEDSVERRDITIYLLDPGWSSVYFYAWDGNRYIEDSWPGERINATVTIGGQRYYYRTFSVADEEGYTMNIIFNKGSNAGQTVDITGIDSDRYYEIASTTNKYTVRDITATAAVTAARAGVSAAAPAYDLAGRRVSRRADAVAAIRRGVYVVQGRKVAVR